MNVIRMFLGILLFLLSSWISPFISDVLGLDQGISFLAVGGVLAFLGGMIFYSGVKACRYSYQF